MAEWDVRGREQLCGAFAAAAAKTAISAPIHCPEFGGDRYTVAAPVRRPGAGVR